MSDEHRAEARYNTTLESPLSSLLRSLYLHGVEHCALATAKGFPIFSKDQIVSLLERGNADTKVCEAFALLSSNGFACLTEQQLMEPLTPVLLVTDRGVELVPAGRIPQPSPREEDAAPDEEITDSGLPCWWTVPLPLALLTGKKTLLNPAAEKLLEGYAPSSFGRKKKHPKEFLLELSCKSTKKRKAGSKHFLFTELKDSFFLIQDVTEDLQSADQMAWLASIGQAFLSDLKCKGIPVRQIRSPEYTTEEENGKHLACIWEEKLLGYVCIDDEQNE